MINFTELAIKKANFIPYFGEIPYPRVKTDLRCTVSQNIKDEIIKLKREGYSYYEIGKRVKKYASYVKEVVCKILDPKEFHRIQQMKYLSSKHWLNNHPEKRREYSRKKWERIKKVKPISRKKYVKAKMRKWRYKKRILV